MTTGVSQDAPTEEEPGAVQARRFTGPEGLEQLAGAFRATPEQRAGFRAEVRRLRVDHISVRALAATPCETDLAVLDWPNRVLWLTFIASGRVTVLVGDRTEALEPGDLLAWSTPHAPRSIVEETSQCIAVSLVPPAAPAALADLTRPVVIPAGERVATVGALGALLRPLVALPAGPIDVGARSMARGLHDLVLVVVSEVLQRLPESDPATTWLRAHLAIEQSLARPDLAPADIAAAVGVAPRTLQAVFAARECSIARTIRERRLELAADRLLDDPAEPAVAAVAADVGFAGADQFARAFRARYGVSPGEYRTRA